MLSLSLPGVLGEASPGRCSPDLAQRQRTEAPMFVAACMEPDERELWTAANAALSQPAISPCQDCPLSFAEEMRRLGCCNGEPGVGLRGTPTNDPRILERRAQWRAAQRRKTGRAA